MTPQLRLLESYAREFTAQLDRVRAFVNHPGSIGTAHEGIVRRFLQRYIPKRLAVSEGFVVDEQGKPSRQCDIIIWSHLDFAPYYQEGDFVIVPAGAVKAVIEVKTKLDKKATREAFENLSSVRKASSDIYTAIFAFKSTQVKTFVSNVIDDEYRPFTNSVDSVFMMGAWWLQRIKNVVDSVDPRIMLMETRPKSLFNN